MPKLPTREHSRARNNFGNSMFLFESHDMHTMNTFNFLDLLDHVDANIDALVFLIVGSRQTTNDMIRDVYAGYI